MAQPASISLPLLVISYHAEDAEWKNRLVSHLLKHGPAFQVLDDQVRDPPSFSIILDAEARAAFQGAQVLLLLLSQAYMRSTWIKSEEGASLFKYGDGPAILTLHVRDTALDELHRLPAHYVPLNHGPLETVSIERQNGSLGRAANAILQLLQKKSVSPRDVVSEQIPSQHDTGTLPISELSRFARSSEVENALRHARRLATGSTPRAVTTAALLSGLAEGGRAEVKYFRTPQFLWDELTKGGDFQYTKMLTEEFAALGSKAHNLDSITDEAELATSNVGEVFKVAEEIARRTGPGLPQIGARHLLAALLVFRPSSGPTGASRRLATIVGDLEAFRRRFCNFIVRSFPDEDHAAWKAILIELHLPQTPPTPQQTSSATADDPVFYKLPSVPGFMADEWTGRDLLGITHDVNALASLVAAYKVEPPLSIGLFGDWGSGKSHFMRQMRKRVELLSKYARGSGKPQNELGYYKNIVQIEFNAWHYIEGNLWASLVDHIFANLKLSEQEDPSYAEQRRDELMQKIGVKEDIQKKINSRVEEREGELRKLEERKQQAEADRDNATTQLEGFKEEAISSLEKLDVPVAFTAEEKELLGRIGIDAGTNISAADVRRNYLKMKSGWNGLKARLRLFLTDPSAKRRYLFSTLLALIPIAGALLVSFKNFPGFPTTVATVLGFVATLYVAAKPAWDQFRKSLSALEKHDEEVERKRQQRITQLESEVRSLTREIVDARLEGEAVGKEVERLKADIESTSSSRILAEFIEDRAAASDYRRHLGLLALIRRDFEKLRVLFAGQRKEEVDGKDISDEKKINRIVLYIDDLDRCPPDRVVQVLQAIHLLLAFPLFVVVVGVDSRWITRSLQQNYEWLGENDAEMSNGDQKEGGQDRDEDRGSGAGATPHDYLEKIFQIPFWLKPMDQDACVEFLDGLTKDSTENNVLKVAYKVEPQMSATGQIDPILKDVAVIETSEPTSVESVEAPVDPIVEDQTQHDFVPARAENTHDEIDLAPRSLTFSTFEIEYMKELVPLIGRSPRAVKRFLNCYRLIKVGLTPAESRDFVEEGKSESYKAVMILLGIITGAPTTSSYVLDKLKTWQPQPPELTVEAFFNTLALQEEVQQQPDAERFFRFFRDRDFGEFSDLLLEDMANFAPRVARFSFKVNRTELLRR
ncbi:MAG TPA: P-loop NTPase fold protein [Pyrinomonadaceae bacterium]|nr:P-loop NTPase fold protein [Pyrinomonadaceae bacterium]